MYTRKETRQVRVGPVRLGGGAPIAVQSMTNTDTRDIRATVAQIQRLASLGCEIVRVAVPDEAAARSLVAIKRESPLPVVADVHFDYRLALMAIEAGVDKIRLNPGNIGGQERIKVVVRAAKERGIPIRIGVNAGSLPKEIREKYQGVTAEAMAETALAQVRLLEDLSFTEIVLSLKASDIPTTVEAYRLVAERVNYPLHLGITEAGTVKTGVIRSAVGLGILLSMGLGDTVRVSLAGDPEPEVTTAWEILKALRLRQRGAEVIACPTCGRCQVNVAQIAEEIEARLANYPRPVRVAVMGCVVNGPGEAAEADVGIAGGRNEGLVFRRGKPVRKVPASQLVEALLTEIKRLEQGEE